MSDCLFCKIISGEIPSQKIYEDRSVLAFLDMNPCNPGHALVVPKRHCEKLLDASGEDLRSIISVIPRIAAAILKAFNYKAFNLGVNNGAIAGQVIPHLHFHIVPRKEGDGYELFRGVRAEPVALEDAAERIKTVLAKEN